MEVTTGLEELAAHNEEANEYTNTFQLLFLFGCKSNPKSTLRYPITNNFHFHQYPLAQAVVRQTSLV
jgi:hypothetical protein